MTTDAIIELFPGTTYIHPTHTHNTPHTIRTQTTIHSLFLKHTLTLTKQQVILEQRSFFLYPSSQLSRPQHDLLLEDAETAPCVTSQCVGHLQSLDPARKIEPDATSEYLPCTVCMSLTKKHTHTQTHTDTQTHPYHTHTHTHTHTTHTHTHTHTHLQYCSCYT